MAEDESFRGLCVIIDIEREVTGFDRSRFVDLTNQAANKVVK